MNAMTDVPEFKWWYRWVGAAGTFARGGTALAIAVPELARPVGDPRACRR